MQYNTSVKVRIHLLLQMVQRHEYHYDTCTSFFSGSDTIPPGGHPLQPAMYIDSSAVLPVASTCALYLTLITRNVHNPNEYREN